MTVYVVIGNNGDQWHLDHFTHGVFSTRAAAKSLIAHAHAYERSTPPDECWGVYDADSHAWRARHPLGKDGAEYRRHLHIVKFTLDRTPHRSSDAETTPAR